MKTLSRNLLGIFVGYITAVATTIVLAILMLAIFSSMLTRSAPQDILMTSTGPLLYSLASLWVAIVVGVYVAAQLSQGARLANAVALAIVYALYSYWLSQSPSNLDRPYPDWYVISSYALLLPAALLGHLVASKLGKTGSATPAS